MLNKKADAGLTAIVIIILILVFIGWLVNLGSRECNSNSDCGKDAYCGVDHGCHKIPIIERTVTVTQRDYTKPSLILGAAIVIGSIFFNFDKIRPRRKQPQAPNLYY
ncbi:hypothetical protein KY361_05815 [Candidatus Woesearchaeota archaeon]|nr:hypothetical protein [Candidatus Woesearchaeota archaeon]